jgi:hypothetical protein
MHRSLLQHSKIAQLLMVQSRSTTPLLPRFMHQAIFLAQVACSVSKFSQHPTSLATPTLCLLSPTILDLMEIGCIQLFFSFQYRRKHHSCALITWFVHADEHDPDTGKWTVTQERDPHGKPTYEVIHIDSIARVVHLVPIFGSSWVLEDFDYHHTLDSYNSFFVNHFVNHHAHEFIGGK